MSHEANILKVLPFDEIDYVHDVGVDVDRFAEEVRPVAESGESRPIHAMTLFLESVRNPTPAPAAEKGAVDEDEDFWSGLRLRRADELAGCGCRSKGGRDRMDILCKLFPKRGISDARLISLCLIKIILVAFQFFAFSHSQGHKAT